MQYSRYPIAFIAWLSLGIQVYLTSTTVPEGELLASELANLFSYFTILTNLLVACSLTFVNTRFFSDNRTHGAITVYIVAVGLIYALVLQKLYDPQGLNLFTDVAFHYITPSLYFLHWLLVVEKGDYVWPDAMRWLMFPGAYLIYTLFRGSITGWYPYPFIDVTELGYLYAIRNSLAVAGVFWVLGMGVVAIDKAMSRPERIGAD